jgi:protein involved in polysaccharide export with SLBB domain
MSGKQIIHRILLSAALAAASLPCASAAQGGEPSRTLRPGDALRVSVWNNDRLSGEFVVGEDGTLIHPLYRSLQVNGVAFPELDGMIGTFLQRFDANPRFVTEPLVRLSVGGEVRQPDLYRVPPQTSIAQAIVLAGGPTASGRLQRVRLVRDGQERVLDLTDPAVPVPLVRSGDEIFVQRRTNVFREYITPAGGITAAVVSLLNLFLK